MLLITPYESVGLIRLGMSLDDLVRVAGTPSKITRNRRAEFDYQYGGYNVRISPTECKVVEVGVSAETSVELGGVNIFNDPNALARLVEMDGHPYEFLGYLILLSLGVAITGFHDGDVAQRAITMFEKGRWDHLRSQFKTWSAQAKKV